MEFLDHFPNLESAQREQFRKAVTRLLSGEVLTPGSPMKPDPDWRFAERYSTLIDSYLRIGGWQLEYDATLRLARARHEAGAQRVRFSKFESLLLCFLRLYYHEQMRTLSESEDLDCEIAVGMLRERLAQAGRRATQLSRNVILDPLRRFARHSLVRLPRGFEARDDEKIFIAPLIEKVLPPHLIEELEQRFREYAGSLASEGALNLSPEADAESSGSEGEADETA
ncbi:MAG: DUF4194 domain-containing protein [Acidobacteriia bacterium]|nr:DUF4194 domain-containing protein [Terriglobia bacterium]